MQWDDQILSVLEQFQDCYEYLKPLIQGDTVSVSGSVVSTEQIDAGLLVTINIQCENQNGEKTAIGQGSAVVK